VGSEMCIRDRGKTTMARILAKALNCLQGPTSTICNACEHCIEITEGRSPDVIEIDAASNRGIDNIRELRSQAVFAPMRARYKVYILDEVHMLSNEAFNALLKTLEEPPHHVVFIMATTELHRVPETITSRCQVFAFRKFSTKEIVGRLAQILDREKIAYEKSALLPIAERGEGSLRDAISILDQVLAFAAGESLNLNAVRAALDILPAEFYARFLGALRTGNLHTLLDTIHQLAQNGANLRVFLRDLLAYIRAVVLVAENAEPPELSAEELESAKRQAHEWDRAKLIRSFQLLFRLNQELGQMLTAKSSELRIAIEIALVDLVHKLNEPSVSALVQKIERLKNALESGQPFQDTPQKNPSPAEQSAGTDASLLLQKAFLGEEVKVNPEAEKLF
ncbi:MAG: DNA polymerase III subunit gamma/tau, partial [Turneriella sp.]|nr:DNA polymerase III subunit gamma/tau [Turneriella sp.]